MKLTNILENQSINELFKVDAHAEWKKYDDVLVTYISVNDKKIRVTLTATNSDDDNLKFANFPNDIKKGYTIIFSVDERMDPTGNFGVAASVVIGKIVSVLFEKLKTLDWGFVYFSTGNLRLSKFYKATAERLSKLLHGTNQISPSGFRFVIVNKNQQQLDENFALDNGARVIKNPSTDGLINLVMRDSHREYRGLIDGNDIYWWPSSAAIHSKVGKMLGYDPTEDDRLYISYSKSSNKIYFYRDGTWTVDKMQQHQQLKKFLDNENVYFDNIYGNWVIGKELTESFIDNTKGWGNTPNNENVDYLGLRVKMKPSQFLSLASYLHPEHATSVDPILDHLKKGGKIGAPFLEIVVPEEWSTGDLSKPAKIVGHDGRNRMTAMQELEGDSPVETHLFFRNELRRRHIKPEWIEELNKRLIPQNQKNPTRGPFFTTSLNESIANDGQDYIILKNPSPDALLSLCKKLKYNELRGLAHENDVYWWDAYKAEHNSTAERLGIEGKKKHMYFFNPDRLEVNFWKLEEITSIPQLNRMIKSNKIRFRGLRGEWVFGKELVETMSTIPSRNTSLNEAIKLENGTIVVKNPSADTMLNMVKKTKTKELRGLVHDNDIYWWDAYDANHNTVARELGIDDHTIKTHIYFNDSDHLDLRSWSSLDKLKNHPQFNQLLKSNKIKFRNRGGDWVFGKYLKESPLWENFTKIKLESPEFKNWFGNSKVVDAEGNPIPVYHGTGRPDRVANQFRKSRATAGPMSYFTEHPATASNYATGKADTSITDDGGYETWFKVKIKGMRTPVNIDRAWYFLPSDEKSKITKLAPRVKTDDNAEEIILGDENQTNGLGDIKQKLKYSKNNFLMALVQEWLTSGNLFGKEQDFIKVLKLAGMTTPVSYEPPHATYPAVYSVYLSIQNPLDTSNIQQKVIDALGKAVKRQPYKAPTNTMWNKKFIPAQEWYSMFLHPQQGTYAWTIIPDWVTKTLIALGYDGIKDVGGKGGGERHTVWIPFYENQVKSAISNTAFGRSKSIIKEKIEINRKPDNFSIEYSKFNNILMKFTVAGMPYKFGGFEIKPLFSTQKGIWHISFSTDDDQEEDRYDITNTGNAYQVLNSVGYCIQQLFKNRKDITGIYFTGEGSSRIKLYDRLAPIFTKNGLSQEHDIKKYISLLSWDDEKSYLFLKKENINEVFNNIGKSTGNWEKTDSMVSGTLPTQNIKTPMFSTVFYYPRNDGTGNDKIQILFKQDWKNSDGKKLFDLTTGIGYEIVFAVNGKLGVTNQSGNNASSLLKKIIEKINGFIQTNHCDYIYFSADRRSPSRVKIYDAITNRLSKNGGSTLLSKNFGYSKYYVLKIDSMDDELDESFHTSKEPVNLDIKKQDVIEKNGLQRIDDNKVEQFVSMNDYSPENQTYLFLKPNIVDEGIDISKEPTSMTVSYSDDHNLQIDFMVNGELYNFNAGEMDDNTGAMTKIWEISFNLKKKSRSYFGVTKTGNAKQVFRSIGWCVDYLLKHHQDAKGVFFTADSPSRTKLYDALSRLFLAKGLTRYKGDDIEQLVDLYNISHGDEIYLFLSKNSIEEAIDILKKPNNMSVVFDDENNLLIEFTVGNHDYKVRTYKLDNYFANYPYNIWQISFEINISHNKYGITGTGNSQSVLSSVGWCINYLLKNKNPKGIFFTAGSPSRIKLYDALNKLFLANGLISEQNIGKYLDRKLVDIPCKKYLYWVNKSLKNSIEEDGGGVGLVVPGVNMPTGIHPDEIRRQAKKFGNKVSKNGVPPVARPDGIVKESKATDEYIVSWGEKKDTSPMGSYVIDAKSDIEAKKIVRKILKDTYPAWQTLKIFYAMKKD